MLLLLKTAPAVVEFSSIRQAPRESPIQHYVCSIVPCANESDETPGRMVFLAADQYRIQASSRDVGNLSLSLDSSFQGLKPAKMTIKATVVDLWYNVSPNWLIIN